MPKLFKPDRPYPLPPDAEILTRGGKPYVRVVVNGKASYFPVSKDGTKYLRPAAKWAADVRFADGRRRRVRLSANREAAAVMLADLLKRVENERAGVVDRFAEHRRRPLSAHLDDWQASLEASGRAADYVALKLGRVRAAFDGCAFVMPADMTADRLETFLVDLRTAEKRSVQTANDWLQAVRQFCRWMVANGRLDRDPFARLRPGNANLDRKRRRGELAPDEIQRLLAAASANPVMFRGLTGPDRCMIYRTALGTGFRASELAALVPDHFDLSARLPVVLLPAPSEKNRKGTYQPIPDVLAAELREYLRGRPGKEPVWPGTWADRSADMLRLDLAAAEVPDVMDGPEGEEVRDFHALRNCFISDVLRAGADLKQAMTLARHSDPRLTTARYARTRLHDLTAVLNKIANKPAAGPEAGALRMTGTDANSPAREQQREQQGAATGAATGDGEGWRLRVAEGSTGDEQPVAGNAQPPKFPGVGADQPGNVDSKNGEGGKRHPLLW